MPSRLKITEKLRPFRVPPLRALRPPTVLRPPRAATNPNRLLTWHLLSTHRQWVRSSVRKKSPAQSAVRGGTTTLHVRSSRLLSSPRGTRDGEKVAVGEEALPARISPSASTCGPTTARTSSSTYLAGAEDFTLALGAFKIACERWPKAAITLRQGARVIEDSRRLRLAWTDKGRQGGL